MTACLPASTSPDVRRLVRFGVSARLTTGLAVGFAASLTAGLAAMSLPGAAHACDDPAHDHAAQGPHGHGAGCGSYVRESERRQLLDQWLAGSYAPLAQDAGVTYVVPIVLHVVRRSDGTGGMTPAEILNTYGDLLDAFEGTGITFCQPFGVDTIDDDGFFSDIDTLTEIDALRQTNVVGNAINIYFTPELALPGLPLCGISSFTSSDVQGIVMRNSCTAAGGNPSTLAHEVGHYFDLFHTHETAFGVECPDGSNCAIAGDLVCDTPADPRLGSINVDLDTCEYFGTVSDPCNGFGAGYDPDTSLFMSYAPSGCRSTFSPEQIERMRSTLVNLRPELAQTECPDLSVIQDPRIDILSLTPSGGFSDDTSTAASISGDGRFVVFTAFADDLDPADVNNQDDIYIVDRTTGERSILTVTENGEPAFGASREAAISADGRYVALLSWSANLLDPEASGSMGWQALRLDRTTGTYELASTPGDGVLANQGVHESWISANGRFVLFSSGSSNLVPDDTNGFTGRDLFVRDMDLGTIDRVNVSTDGVETNLGYSHSFYSVGISDDGRYVVFQSPSATLVPGDTNTWSDIFIRDRELGTTERLSVAEDGTQGTSSSGDPSISADGRYVSFRSASPNLVQGDVNGSKVDIFLLDRETGSLELVPIGTYGQLANGVTRVRMTPDARRFALLAVAEELEGYTEGVLNAYILDRISGRVGLASPRGGPVSGNPAFFHAALPSIDHDGRDLVFSSMAANIVPGDFGQQVDVFVMNDANPRWDIDGDGVTDMADVIELLASWGPCPVGGYCPADADGDGMVGFADLIGVLSAITIAGQ